MILHNVDMYSDVTTLAAGGLSWQQTTGNVPLKGTLSACSVTSCLWPLWKRDERGRRRGSGDATETRSYVATTY